MDREAGGGVDNKSGPGVKLNVHLSPPLPQRVTHTEEEPHLLF
jgi:hypothetical protein